MTTNYTTTAAIVAMLALAMLSLSCSKTDGNGDGEASAAASESGATNIGSEGDKAPTAAVDTSLPGDPVKGEAVYEKTCLACHGADGKGNGGITGADFIADKSRLAKDNQELLTSIREGKKGKTSVMPPQKDVLSDQEIKDSLAYIRATFGKK